MMHLAAKFEARFKDDKVWQARMLCGTVYSLALPRGKRPWTKSNITLVTCEGCKAKLRDAKVEGA